MPDFKIVPEKKESSAECCAPSPEKDRYPSVTFSGSALDALTELCGDLNVDEEYILKDVRIRVTGRTHNEWTRNAEVAILSADGVEEVAGTEGMDDGDESKDKGKARNAAVEKAAARVGRM